MADFVAAVDGSSADSAWVKHYNFVDFSRFGSTWSPRYFNVVRDPVERVKINEIIYSIGNHYFSKLQIVSWFYYWRAAWNVVERKLAFPEQPLPDPKMLRMDFDTCVRTGTVCRRTQFCIKLFTMYLQFLQAMRNAGIPKAKTS